MSPSRKNDPCRMNRCAPLPEEIQIGSYAAPPVLRSCAGVCSRGYNGYAGTGMRPLLCGPIAVVLLLLTIGFRDVLAAKDPVFTVRTRTVVAFFAPVTARDLDDEDTNEDLSDFQYYDDEVRAPFKKAGIELHETYTRSFSIRLKGRVLQFHTTRNNDVGYYFIAPGRKPHVEYGVMTDEDLLDVAHDYFGVPVPDDSQDMARALLLAEPIGELFPPVR
jgi:hypothetical protein